MDGSGNRENGRHKPDQYRPVQWIMPQHQMKDHHTAHAVKIMAAIAERDSALHERDLALSEKRTAQAERDMAIFQRDAAITERNNAIIERDNAISALEYTRGNGINGGNNGHNHHTMNNSSSPQSSDSPYNQKRETHVPKREPKAESVVTSKRAPKSEKKRSKKRGESVGEDLNKQVTVAQMHGEWRGEDAKPPKKHRKEWKLEDLGGLNEVVFDESTMPVPVCSCTGRYQPCYKWGNGGWQSACCTTTLSMYPLPMMPNKRHARVNGRKMSGSVFTKLLSRLAAEGHDLSVPLDLKDHWSKHGTNRYITIK